MNRKKFIEKLVILYEDFTEKNLKPRKEAYEFVLDEKIDYDNVYKKLLKNYESFKFAPTPATILRILNETNNDVKLQKESEFIKQLEAKDNV